MSKFKVGFWYTEYGTTEVEGDDWRDAERNLHEQLADDGIDNLVYDTTDRDYGAQCDDHEPIEYKSMLDSVDIGRKIDTDSVHLTAVVWLEGVKHEVKGQYNVRSNTFHPDTSLSQVVEDYESEIIELVENR